MDDDPVELLHGRYRLQLALGLPARAVDTQGSRVLASEVLRGDAARGARAQLAELVRLHDGEELARFRVEEHRVEAGTATGDGVSLETESPNLRRPR
jgi:hypothetical protein